MNTVQPKFGITERKKRELDNLTQQKLDVENEVTQLQAIVTSLTEKSATFQSFLTLADTNKTQALTNKNLIDAVVKYAKELKANATITFNEMIIAKSKSVEVAKSSNNVINKLIYSAESINKLANKIVRKKAQNPLISDELVNKITTAATDANNAVALALVALKSTFAAQAMNQESEAISTLCYTQAIQLFEVVTVNTKSENEQKESIFSLQTLLENAYTKSLEDYTMALNATNETLNELNLQTAKLNKVQIKLKSLQLGLAAANAVALAS